MIPPRMRKVANYIYNKPASVTLISSPKHGWKTGKTDWALELTEILDEMNIIHKFASNIETKDDPQTVTFIQDFPNFDFWANQDHHPKMFLYDEAIESSPRRSAMTSLNVGWVKRIPQLSKGHCHLVVIAQTEELIDSIFQFPTFYRGTWIKVKLKTLVFRAPWLQKEYLWQNVPRTNHIFDPYLGATFKMEGSSNAYELLPLPLKVLHLYGTGNSLTSIQASLGLDHTETVRRLLQRACKAVSLTLAQQPSEGNKLKEICVKSEA